MAAHGHERRSPRAQVSALVCVKLDSHEEVELMAAHDLGLGGIFVCTPSPPPIGTGVELTLIGADGSTLSLRAAVVHAIRELPIAPSPHPLGMGLQFRDLLPDEELVLLRLMRAAHGELADGSTRMPAAAVDDAAAELELQTVDLHALLARVGARLQLRRDRIIYVRRFLSASVAMVRAEPTSLERNLMILGSRVLDELPDGWYLTLSTQTAGRLVRLRMGDFVAGAAAACERPLDAELTNARYELTRIGCAVEISRAPDGRLGIEVVVPVVEPGTDDA